MALILCIETGTDICSVGLVQNGELISLRESDSGRDHAKKVAVYVDELLEQNNLQPEELDAVAVGEGPGSYTGLRIGVSFAKGLCYGVGKPLIAVSSLASLTAVAMEDYEAGILDIDNWDNSLLCPMIDARRMEVYSAIYDRALRPVRDIQADVVDADTYRQYLDSHPVYFFGNGAEKCMDVIAHPNAHLIKDIEPLAKNMFPLAEKKLMAGETEDVAYFVPFYLKDFVAIKPKKLL